MTEVNDNVVSDGLQVEDVDTLRRHYGGLRAAILTELFSLPSEAQNVDIQMGGKVQERLGKAALDKVKVAHGELFARDKIEAAKVRFIENELEMAAAIQALAERASEVLSPRQATTTDVLQASTMTSDQILAASEVARSMGDAGEDTLLVLLRACIERDLDQEAWHIAAMNPEWEQALTVIGEASQLPDEPDPDEIAARFDAQSPESAVQLLGGGESELNRLGHIR